MKLLQEKRSMELSENETWKDVIGFEGFYKVSDRGNVYSVERKDSMGRKQGGLMLKPRYHTNGYLQVDLRKDGIRKSELIHRLVAGAFIPNQNNYLEINHKDEIKTNNELSNLEWCDSGYNINYGTRNEKISKKIRAVNIENGEVLTFNSTVEAGKEGYHKVSQACRGVYTDPSGKLIRGDGRTYKGYRWYYEEGEDVCNK